MDWQNTLYERVTWFYFWIVSVHYFPVHSQPQMHFPLAEPIHHLLIPLAESIHHHPILHYKCFAFGHHCLIQNWNRKIHPEKVSQPKHENKLIWITDTITFSVCQKYKNILPETGWSNISYVKNKNREFYKWINQFIILTCWRVLFRRRSSLTSIFSCSRLRFDFRKVSCMRSKRSVFSLHVPQEGGLVHVDAGGWEEAKGTGVSSDSITALTSSWGETKSVVSVGAASTLKTFRSN